MSDLDGLIARIRALEAERAILATLYRYGHTIGVGDEDGWLDCFAPDGVFDVRRRVVASPADPSGNFANHPHPDVRGGTRPSVRYDGRDGLRRFIAQHPRPPQRYHKHIVVDPVIAVTGTVATVESFFLRVDAGPDGVPHVTAFGRYHDRMVEGPDGRWRFAERIAEVESRGPDPFG
jgi:hypothetical protein